MEGDGGLAGLPPIPRQKELAEQEFHRIMQGAARLQQIMGTHLFAAGTSRDPVRQAEAMNRAIALAEQQLLAFRRARDVLEVARPGFTLPPPPPPSPALQPSRVGRGKPIPKHF